MVSNTDRLIAAFTEALEGQRSTLDAGKLTNLNVTLWVKPREIEVTMRPELKTTILQ